MELHGWGKFPTIKAKFSEPSSIEDIQKAIKKGNLIARGNGRSYGDSAISVTNTISMKKFNRMLEFDEKTGLLVVESGILLADIIKIFLPRGWFAPVTPGTKYVTVGGMVATNVHGKNHHNVGSFGNFISWIDIIDARGKITRCSNETHNDLFHWTIGGMGLTGVIMHVAFFLKPISTAWIKQTTISAENINATMELFDKHKDVTYSVAWIDCLAKGSSLGRSLVMLGEHARLTEISKKNRVNPFDISIKRPLKICLTLPQIVLNYFTVKLFNTLYFRLGKANCGVKIIDCLSYFYPLDRLDGWNRLYGKRGFLQYQCVIPTQNSEAGIKELLQVIAEAGAGSFLGVLKKFSNEKSQISFPRGGYTLALDFPATEKSIALMGRLDQLVIKHKGRVYLAKDSRMEKEILLAMDPRVSKFKKFRQPDYTDIFSSSQSKRLGL